MTHSGRTRANTIISSSAQPAALTPFTSRTQRLYSRQSSQKASAVWLATHRTAPQHTPPNLAWPQLCSMGAPLRSDLPSPPKSAPRRFPLIVWTTELKSASEQNTLCHHTSEMSINIREDLLWLFNLRSLSSPADSSCFVVCCERKEIWVCSSAGFPSLSSFLNNNLSPSPSTQVPLDISLCKKCISSYWL